MSCSDGSCNCGERLTNVDGRLTNVEERLTGVEGRLTSLERRVDRGFDQVDEQFKRVDERFDQLTTMIKKMMSLRGHEPETSDPATHDPFVTGGTTPTTLSTGERDAAQEGGDRPGANRSAGTATSDNSDRHSHEGGDAALP